MTAAKTVAFHTLGCKLNFSETSALSRMLENDGFEKREFDEQADIYVINTCSVTENADKECRYLVRRIRRNAPQSMVVITGCYAQLKPKEIAAIDGVDLVLGAAEKFNIGAHLKQLDRNNAAKICSCEPDEISGFHSSFSINDRTRSFLKVQDGCNYNCSFCTIPMARGKSRSDTIDHVTATARELGARGIREIILTGVNLGDFGLGADGRQRQEDFFQLLLALESVEEIDRFRISSIEPNLLTNPIIELVAGSSRLMPHFHIPLQSGSNRILALMRRRYKRELYADRVSRIKALMPHCAIGADVITGFPGETDADFAETAAFLQDIDVSYLHVFTYSERANTQALDIKPIVPVNVRQNRNKQLRTLSYMKMQQFTEQHRSQKRKVLFEAALHGNIMEGYTDNYIRISAPFRAEWVNNLIEWTI